MSDPNFDANASIGALEIGILLSAFLFGAITVQTHSYYLKFQKDNWKLKCLVALVWFLELGHAVCVTHMLYTVSVLQYGRPQELDAPPYSFNVAILLSGIILPLVQAFFTNRLRIISGTRLLPIFCWFLLLVRFLGIMVLGAVAFKMDSLDSYVVDWKWLIISVLAVGTCVDVVVSWSLCYYLWETRKDAFNRTTRVVDHLIAWTFQTSLITSCMSVVTLIICLTMNSFAWISVLVILSRVFSNCLLASLNSRTVIRQPGRSNTVDFSTFYPEAAVVAITKEKVNPARGVGMRDVKVSNS